MDKQEWKQFLRWLDEADADEIASMRPRLAPARQVITDPDVRADTRRMLRLIDEEVLIRQSLATRVPVCRSRKA